jgi:hypothetical protein
MMNDTMPPGAGRSGSGHSDPDILAMMAMGEPDIPLADEAHVRGCEECQDELSSLLRVTTLARSGSPLEHPLDAPDPAVWSRISASLGFSTDVAPAVFATADDPTTEIEDEPPLAVPSAGAPTTAAPSPAAPRSTVRGHRAPRRRRRRLLAPVLAGALAIVVATGAILIATGTLSFAPSAPTPTVLAEVRLKALPDWTGSSGEAVIEKSGSSREVQVTLSESHSAPGYREVWLISSDLKKLISVGVLTGTEGSFPIPAGVNLADYPIVDVSSEQTDGNPAHSGDSIVRGTI